MALGAYLYARHRRFKPAKTKFCVSFIVASTTCRDVHHRYSPPASLTGAERSDRVLVAELRPNGDKCTVQCDGPLTAVSCDTSTCRASLSLKSTTCSTCLNDVGEIQLGEYIIYTQCWMIMFTFAHCNLSSGRGCPCRVQDSSTAFALQHKTPSPAMPIRTNSPSL
jgi:hypothetical protein